LNNIVFGLDSSIRSSLQYPNSEDDDGDPDGSDVPSGSTSSINARLPLRISRL